MDRGRIVLHVDMDAFYASVEERDDPSLRGRPLAIGSDPKGGKGRGVLCTANYAARAFGLHSAQPVSEAYRLCPQAVFLPPDFPRYKQASRTVMEVLAAYASPDAEGRPLLEVVGMDEAYLDVTETVAGDWSRVVSLSLSLQAAVRRATGLSCSIGAGPAKSMAKIASDYRKPHGVTAVSPERLDSFLEPLPVGKLHGCGPKTAARLREAGFATVGELRTASLDSLTAEFGSHGAWLWHVARGLDDRPVSPDRGARKSRGNESTFPQDVGGRAATQRLHGLLEEVLEEQARDGRAWSTLTIKVRYRGFETVTRSHTFPVPVEPGHAPESVAAMLDALVDPLLDGRPIRLVGVRLSNFVEAAGQRTLGTYGVGAVRPRRPQAITAQPQNRHIRGQQVLVQVC